VGSREEGEKESRFDETNRKKYKCFSAGEEFGGGRGRRQFVDRNWLLFRGMVRKQRRLGREE